MPSRGVTIAVKIIQGLAVCLVLLLMTGLIVCQVPSVQTWAADKVAEAVGDEIDGDITIGGLSVVFFNRVSLRDVTVTGHGAPAPWGGSDSCRYHNPGDTLGHIGRLSVSFRLSDLLSGRLGVHRVVMEDGFFNLLMEDSLHRSNLNRIFGLPLPDPDMPHSVFPDLFADDIKLRRCGFSLGDPFNKLNESEPVQGQMQYNNLKIRNITGHFRNLRTTDGEVSCRILELSATESCGAGIEKLSGDFHLGPRGSGMDGMYLKDVNGSVIEADNLYFIYSTKEEIADWVNSVVMDVRFRESQFNFNSIRYFAPLMADNHLALSIHGGSVNGPVSDMDIRGLDVSLPEGGTSVNVTAVLKGIPDMPNTRLDGTVYDRVTTKDVSRILSEWSGHPLEPDISRFAAGEVISQRLSACGPFRNLSVTGGTSIGGGHISHQINLSLFTPSGVSVGGQVQADSVDLGAVLATDLLGKLDMQLRGSVSSGREGGVNLEYMDVSRMGFKGYDYSGIAASGEVSDTLLSLWIAVRDPGLKMELNADAEYDEKDRAGHYSLGLELPYVDLKSLNLITGNEKSKVSGLNVFADVEFNGDDNAVGRLSLRNLKYENENGTIAMDSLMLNSSYRDSVYAVNLRSPFVKASYTGDDPLLSAVFRAKDILVDRQFSDVLPAGAVRYPEDEPKGNDSLTILTNDIWKVSRVLSKGVYFSDGSELDMKLSDTDSIDIRFTSSRVAKHKNYFRNLDVHIDNPDTTVRLKLKSSEVRAGQFIFKDNVIDVLVSGGLIGVNYMFKGNDKGRAMNFSSDLSFGRDEEGFLETDIGLNSAVLYLDDKKWDMDTSKLVIGHRHFGLDGFRFHSGRQSLNAGGILSDSADDSMGFRLDSLDLSVLNTFLVTDMKLSGTMSGSIDVRDVFNNPDFLIDIKGSDISFFGSDIGRMRVLSKRDQTHERINLLLSSRYMDKSPINITGWYEPLDSRLFLNSSLKDLSLAYAKPFLDGVLSIDGGTLSGDILLFGSGGRYELRSEDARFVDLAFTPVSTNVPYTMNGGMKFTHDAIVMDDVNIMDRNGHPARLEGAIKHDFLRNMALDLKLTFDDLECIDIQEYPDVPVYGTASASGVISVTGPVNDILLSGAIRTGSNTSIHVPISNAYAASSNDILVFKDYSSVEVDPYDSLMTGAVVMSDEKVKVRVKADATIYEDAEVVVELDRNLGNIIECHGNAKVQLNLDPSKSDIDLRGFYNVSGGKARYTFAGLISREFTLNDGGKLSFRGPISATQVDIGATYRTRTSISGLIADTSSVSSRQTVYASVGLKGGLDNPRFNFAINIPDVDPLTKGRVETALSTDAKVQQQFMSLMLTGSFMRNEQSGITDNGNILYSNVSEMLSNQFNNVLRSLNVPLDVGLNYQKSGSRKDMIDVNLSYQAFNNRLTLSGSVNNSNRYSNWGGNFEAEIKMDKRGKFRFSLFTRAADQYSNYIDYSQRNGVGFSFQDEFTRFSEIFMSRRKKEKLELEMVEKATEELLEEQALAGEEEHEEREEGE